MPLVLKNSNKAQITDALNKLYMEWLEWSEQVKLIEDHPYDKNTHAGCYADGEQNIQKHRILREKTLTFLNNNIQGHNFMSAQTSEWPSEYELNRLAIRVPERIHELDILKESLQYATAPDSFWKEQGKKFVANLVDFPKAILSILKNWL